MLLYSCSGNFWRTNERFILFLPSLILKDVHITFHTVDSFLHEYLILRFHHFESDLENIKNTSIKLLLWLHIIHICHEIKSGTFKSVRGVSCIVSRNLWIPQHLIKNLQYSDLFWVKGPIYWSLFFVIYMYGTVFVSERP